MTHVVPHIGGPVFVGFPEDVDQNKAPIGGQHAGDVPNDLLLLRFVQMMNGIAADDKIDTVVGLLRCHAYHVITDELVRDMATVQLLPGNIQCRLAQIAASIIGNTGGWDKRHGHAGIAAAQIQYA